MALLNSSSAFQQIDRGKAMRVPLPFDATAVPGGIYTQNCAGRPVAEVERGLTSHHPAKRSCRLCDPVSGQCRHLCVPKSGRKIK
jgi:hypothetical protein